MIICKLVQVHSIGELVRRLSFRWWRCRETFALPVVGSIRRLHKHIFRLHINRIVDAAWQVHRCSSNSVHCQSFFRWLLNNKTSFTSARPTWHLFMATNKAVYDWLLCTVVLRMLWPHSTMDFSEIKWTIQERDHSVAWIMNWSVLLQPCPINLSCRWHRMIDSCWWRVVGDLLRAHVFHGHLIGRRKPLLPPLVEQPAGKQC